MTIINCDMGEGFGLYRIGDDAALMPLITVANVACGFHASDFNHMHNTVRLAKRHGVGVGAHPSLPDLQGFGRREMKIGRDELANCLIYQIGVLKGFLEAESMKLNHIKAHGSLYGIAGRDPEMAHALCDAADVFKVPLMGMVGTLHETVCLPRTKSGSIETKSAKDRLSSELAEPARRILTQRQMRSQLVVQQGLRTPTGLAFVSFCIDGIRGLVFAFVSMGRSTRPVVLYSVAR
jgi:lactam utilization protein B